MKQATSFSAAFLQNTPDCIIFVDHRGCHISLVHDKVLIVAGAPMHAAKMMRDIVQIPTSKFTSRHVQGCISSHCR